MPVLRLLLDLLAEEDNQMLYLYLLVGSMKVRIFIDILSYLMKRTLCCIIYLTCRSIQRLNRVNSGNGIFTILAHLKSSLLKGKSISY